MLLACWQQNATMLLACWHHVVSMLLVCCQHVTSMLHVANMLTAYWQHVDRLLTVCWQHVDSKLPACCQCIANVLQLVTGLTRSAFCQIDLFILFCSAVKTKEFSVLFALIKWIYARKYNGLNAWNIKNFQLQIKFE